MNWSDFARNEKKCFGLGNVKYTYVCTSGLHLIVGSVVLVTLGTFEQIRLCPTGQGHLSVVDRFLGKLFAQVFHFSTCHFLLRKQ